MLERNRLFGSAPDPDLVVDLDLLLTDAFLLLGSHLLGGRVNPETFNSEWVAYNPKADLAGVLEAALAAVQVEAALDRPNRKLFAKNYRSYSSGCNRLEKPLELAEYLLRDDSKWTFGFIKNTGQLQIHYYF
jgi:hypothetical protein